MPPRALELSSVNVAFGGGFEAGTDRIGEGVSEAIEALLNSST